MPVSPSTFQAITQTPLQPILHLILPLEGFISYMTVLSVWTLHLPVLHQRLSVQDGVPTPNLQRIFSVRLYIIIHFLLFNKSLQCSCEISSN